MRKPILLLFGALCLCLVLTGSHGSPKAGTSVLDRYMSLPRSLRGLNLSKLRLLRRRLGVKAWKKLLPLLALRPSKAVRKKLKLLAEHVILPSWQLEPFDEQGL